MVATTGLIRTDLLKFRRWLPFSHNLPGAFKPAREENTTWLPCARNGGNETLFTDGARLTMDQRLSYKATFTSCFFLFTQISS